MIIEYGYYVCSLLLSNNMRPQDGENLYHTSTSASISIHFYMILTWTTYAAHLPKNTMTIVGLFMSCIIEIESKIPHRFPKKKLWVSVTQNSILYNAMYSDVAQQRSAKHVSSIEIYFPPSKSYPSIEIKEKSSLTLVILSLLCS